jgi:DEAD/DEAH box helicase domain-containing protein
VNLEQLVDRILARGVAPAELVHRYLPARPARTRPLPPDVDARLAGALMRRGIRRLYTHQAEALAAARARQDLVVVTATASGKTLCYNLPVLDALLRDGASRALYVFPTKALAQDQRAGLADLLQELGGPGTCHTYDGDTPPGARSAIREAGHLVLTNPDMLHAAILPHHTRWVRLFENLRFVVLDELHVYRGVFGSHMANVVRRLRRVAGFYGSRPTFLATSATIRNPGELAERILGNPVRVIDDDGAPSGPRHFFFYNPPLVQPSLGLRRGAVGEAVAWASQLLENGVPTIVFGRSRLQVELMLTYLRRRLDPRLAAAVRGYRGGYLPRERRAVERGLRSGLVRGVVSTNALELGIDVGSLQAAVLCGYPGSIASTWQQAGRAGRREGLSLTVFVAGNDPVDQYLVRHPEYLLEQPPEAGFVHPDNLYVLMDHLKCAAFELPFHAGCDAAAFGPGPTEEMLAFLAEERLLHLAGGTYHWVADRFPASDVNLRGAGDNVVIIDRTFAQPRVIGEVDLWSAMLTVHEEAIYLHEGTQYQVERFDVEEKKAYVREVQVDYYTQADLAVHLQVLSVLAGEGVAAGGTAARGDAGNAGAWQGGAPLPGEAPPIAGAASGVGSASAAGAAEARAAVAAVIGPAFEGPGPEEDDAADGPGLPSDGAPPTPWRPAPPGPSRAHGEVLVSARATLFKKLRLESHENLGWGRIHLPERELHTAAYWLSFPAEAEALLGREALAGGLAGVARALAGLCPLYLLCVPHDLHALPQVRSPFTGAPTIFLWETHPGGVGLAEKAYAAHGELLRAVAERIASCPCASGCPSCVGPPAPGSGSDPKVAARALLQVGGAAG